VPHRLAAIVTGVSLVVLSASAVLANPESVAKGQGERISAVAQAADYVSGKARGEAVSSLAKQHGALVAAAARVNGQSHSSNRPTNRAPAEPGGLKGG
jgi:hypothetical protein